jgi:hypothetical protein
MKKASLTLLTVFFLHLCGCDKPDKSIVLSWAGTIKKIDKELLFDRSIEIVIEYEYQAFNSKHNILCLEERYVTSNDLGALLFIELYPMVRREIKEVEYHGCLGQQGFILIDEKDLSNDPMEKLSPCLEISARDIKVSYTLVGAP